MTDPMKGYRPQPYFTPLLTSPNSASPAHLSMPDFTLAGQFLEAEWAANPAKRAADLAASARSDAIMARYFSPNQVSPTAAQTDLTGRYFSPYQVSPAAAQPPSPSSSAIPARAPRVSPATAQTDLTGKYFSPYLVSPAAAQPPSPSSSAIPARAPSKSSNETGTAAVERAVAAAARARALAITVNGGQGAALSEGSFSDRMAQAADKAERAAAAAKQAAAEGRAVDAERAAAEAERTAVEAARHYDCYEHPGRRRGQKMSDNIVEPPSAGPRVYRDLTREPASAPAPSARPYEPPGSAEKAS